MTDTAATSRILTLVFTDLVGSTALKIRRGDLPVGELIARHREMVRTLASESAGRIIDWAGDGCFLTFDTPSAAVRFALSLQQAHKQAPDLPEVRVGMHMGEVSERSGPDGDAAHPRIEGLAVDLAARLCALAQPMQVLMSPGVADSARQRLHRGTFAQPIRWQNHGGHALKGFDLPIEVREASLEVEAQLAAPASGSVARVDINNDPHEQQTSDRFRLGDRFITPSANEIDGVRVETKAMEVLVALADAAPAVLSAADLLDRVWPNVVVVDNVVHQSISLLRKALGDDARAARYIESIPRRGYRLIAKVTREAPAVRDEGSGGFAAPILSAPIAAPVAAAHRPSIMVLPFQNLSDSQDTQYFASGVHEDLLSRLMRIPGITVISRTTALALANSNRSIPEMAAEAGVTRVLEGSIRRAANRVRLTVQLIAAPAEDHVWAQTYDRELADIFAVQDELALSIAEQLRVRLDPKIVAGFARSGTKNIEAFDLVLRALECRAANMSDFDGQISTLQRAIELDPAYADAYAHLAIVGFPPPLYGVTWAEMRSRALENAQKALSIDPENGIALVLMTNALLNEGGSWATVRAYAARALAAAPGHSGAHRMYGNRALDYRTRLHHWEECHRLNPMDTTAYIVSRIEQRRPAEALSEARRGVEHYPANAQNLFYLSLAYFAAGDSIAGLRQLRRVVQITPESHTWPYVYVELLWAIDQPAAAWRWLEHLEARSPPSATTRGARAWGLLCTGKAAELESFVTPWLARSRAKREPLFYAAHWHARRADEAFRQGESAARQAHLVATITTFQELFALYPEGEGTDEVRIGRGLGFARFAVLPYGDTLLGFLRYATVARQIGDEARATRLAAHLNGILTEQVAPTGLPLERGMLAAFTGDIPKALDEFTKALVPGAWCLPALEVYGVLEDIDGVFHGIAAEPAFQQLIAGERGRRVTLAQQIALEAPDLLDPGDLLKPRA